jgi:sulfatase modifying factor 1
VVWLHAIACAPAVPQGMVQVPGGTFTMGRDGSPHPEEMPAHLVAISPFLLDETLVTVADFRAYVTDTGATTTAERLGFGMVAVVGMDDWKWNKTAGASWRSPWGPGQSLAQGDDHPVVMVSWDDAAAYCRHRDARLPTEAEWEYAMSAGSRTRYPWGDLPKRPDGRWGLNFWQGIDHHANTGDDGFVYTSPVRAYPPNDWGIYDPVGNVWQWTNDWYAADAYARGFSRDPQGPADGWAKVARGGSWWCSPLSCAGYSLRSRGKSQPDSPYPNNGFRCAK